MRCAHTVAEVRAAESALMATLPAGTLMQRAATGLAYAVLDLLGSAYGRRVTLLVGSGDNGGDALFAGAVLARRGVQVEAVLLADAPRADALAALRGAGGRAGRWDSRSRRTLPDVLVDGIVGIGGRPGLRADAAAALAAYAPPGAGVRIVAVDVPSGVGVDTGEVPEGPHVRADLTVTFGTHKIAHLVAPAARACGTVHLVDIGLRPFLPPAPVAALQSPDVAAAIPRPAIDAHKYARGVVGVRAGSGRYPGAGLLAVAGAASGLAGMVRYVGDPTVFDRVREAHPEVVGVGRVQSWAVGSGGDNRAGAALRAALADEVPIVVDAEALRHLEAPIRSESGDPVAAVLTPHAGELAALLDLDRAEVEARPLTHARRAARRYEVVVLLKGGHSIIAAPDGRARVNTSGTPWLATAGAGDVLAGLIGALLAAGLDPMDAASVGSWLHGAAATYASQGGPIVAGDVALALPHLVRSLIA